jgi:hypothetical protein
MEKTSLPIEFESGGIAYSGWATPSDKSHSDGLAKSYHVVLNGVFFGNMSRDHQNWLVDEQRPHDLTHAVGKCLDKTLP